MHQKMILHNKPTLGIEEEEAARRVIRSQNLSQGKEIAAFEDEFCEFLGLSKGHAVALSSGTASLYLSLWALDAHERKITFPSYVCSALRHAVGLVGGYEQITDIQENSPNMDISNLTLSESDVMIAPHMFGIPMDLTNLKNQIVIEDCAQALGAKVNGKYVGLQGTVGIYSFYATKMITTGGQGGMIVSQNKEIIDKIKDYREFDYRHDYKKRFNFQMTDLQAAIGREQLKKLPNFISRRERIFTMYRESALELLDIKLEDRGRLIPVRYRAIARVKDPPKIISALKELGIIIKIPIEDWELLGEPTSFPNANLLTRETISLPIYPSLTDAEVEYIISRIKNTI